ncbi:MAG: hypothetical protein WC728_17630 [Elusimicrobiota bacterium]
MIRSRGADPRRIRFIERFVVRSVQQQGRVPGKPRLCFKAEFQTYLWSTGVVRPRLIKH